MLLLKKRPPEVGRQQVKLLEVLVAQALVAIVAVAILIVELQLSAFVHCTFDLSMKWYIWYHLKWVSRYLSPLIELYKHTKLIGDRSDWCCSVLTFCNCTVYYHEIASLNFITAVYIRSLSWNIELITMDESVEKVKDEISESCLCNALIMRTRIDLNFLLFFSKVLNMIRLLIPPWQLIALFEYPIIFYVLLSELGSMVTQAHTLRTFVRVSIRSGFTTAIRRPCNLIRHIYIFFNVHVSSIFDQTVFGL